MPTPKAHYRIALGERGGQHSWIVHSAKGITWHNIPDELVTLLQKLTVNELLDFSLGSDGRWYVRYRQNGPEKQELSPYLWMYLNQGSSVKIDRLTLGPDAEHWGVHRAADGSFQRFSAVGNRDRFTRLLESRTDKIKSNNQIGFVALGFSGDWAFSVNGHIEHRCGKPFQNELTGGWRARKRVSTIVLSPFARVWIIVWEDGTLSHNLPFNIGNQVEDYCQLHHSLKSNGNRFNPVRPKAAKVKPPRNNQQASNSPTQPQQPTPKSTQSTNAVAKLNSLANATQSLARQVSQTTNRQRNGASAPGAQTFLKPTPAPPPPVQTTINAVQVPKGSLAPASTSNQQLSAKQAPAQPPKLLQVSKAPAVTQPASNVPLTRTGLQQAPRVVPSQTDRSISRVETISAKPRVYVPPMKLSTTLRQLDVTDWKDSYDYNKLVRLFQDGWQHRHLKRCPRIKRIFVVNLPDHLNDSYQVYKDDLETRHGWSGINEKLVFHGTTRSCSLGEGEGDFSLCEISACSLCSILRTSFLVSKAGSAGRSFQRFGPGIYTSSVSSKADDYCMTPSYSLHKFLIVVKVALGKSSIHYRTTQSLTAPPWGYDSVLGEVGIDLNYDEQVLYQNAAVRPAYVIIYERPTSALTSTTTTAAATTTTRPAATTTTRPAATQNSNTYSPFQANTTTTRPAQTTTTTNWFGQTTTTTAATNSSSSSGCIIM